MIRTLQNEYLTVQINDTGAELMSIKDKHNTEYLWDGKKEFWGRRSPVLFPFVGGLNNKTYQYKGIEYPMEQHGFARNMEFKFLNQSETECWHQISSNEETKKIYPFDFVLELGYRLEKNSCQVLWKVKNTGNEIMYFSIGGHPAFLCPLPEAENRGETDAYLLFPEKETLTLTCFDTGAGLAAQEEKEFKLGTTEQGERKGTVKIDRDLFKEDALIIEQNQIHEVSLCKEDGDPYLTVNFDAPLIGIWAPFKDKKAPFICLEPWYGRCDRTGFVGELSEREWENKLEAGELFEASYSITICG